MDQGVIMKQLAVKEDSEDIRAFIRGMDSWSKEINEKDRLLRQTVHKKTSFSSSSSSLKVQEAISEKERGNAYVKKGNFDAAFQCYTRGLECDPNNAMLHANRAMVLLKLDRPDEAETDCSTALRIDPTYVKAYHRRAVARTKLKRLSDAVSDYQQLLNIEPKNKTAKMELARLLGDGVNNGDKKMAAKFEKIAQQPCFAKYKTNESNVEIVLPIQKSEKDRSKKALKRIEISTDHQIDVPKVPVVVQHSSPPLRDRQQQIRPQLKKPKTSTQFYMNWRTLSSCPKFKAEYLTFLHREDYKPLFKHTLQAWLFMDILRIIQQFPYICDISQHLMGLSMVPRISAIVMFLNQEEEGILKELLCVLEQSISLPDYKSVCDSLYPSI